MDYGKYFILNHKYVKYFYNIIVHDTQSQLNSWRKENWSWDLVEYIQTMYEKQMVVKGRHDQRVKQVFVLRIITWSYVY